MNYRYIFLILILLQMSAVYADCIGYHEVFDVRVLDAKNRTVEGVVVQVKFDRGASFGDKYFTTQPLKTNSQGIVHYDILNQGTNTRVIDCNIVINVSIGGTSETKTIVVSEHGSTVNIWMSQLYPARFYVRDQYKSGLENSTVNVDVWGPGVTDSKGMVKGYLETGNHEYFASYLDASSSGTFEVKDDTDFEVIFPYYPVDIEITDDTGAPLNATLKLLDQTLVLPNGHFQYPKMFGQQVPFETEYLGVIVSGVIQPAIEPEIKIRYDTHAPTISEVKSLSEESRPRLSITATDTGIYASGLDVSSMKVTYKTEPSTENEAWHPAVVFTTAKNTFTAEFPEMAPNTIVKFRVEVKDKASNRAEIDGKFTTMVVQNPQNTTQNDSNPHTDPQQDQGIPLIYIIGGVFLLVLAVILVIKLKSKGTGGSS
ncbi:Uncharacterised protein [Candidatus Bilamarchaeum dharawalense]|uniref:Carboxypeptidase regulatory-like domain protein n=1 Tax=Candidatus Bilamarchaeum dharawalense TaxID=2885759 RepID=A0A5E4LQL3_9ARCH|nr:Uncharacterised protein [Candidatus Bilamarchaeum dharawalense]